jgi:hypothetical protein
LEIGIGERRSRVQHDSEGRHAEAAGVVAEQGAQRGGDDIGATTHGFGEDDFGFAAGKFVQRLDEIGESAAKTATRDLTGWDAVGLHEESVHQVVALIVKHNGHVGSAPLDQLGGSKNERRLAGSEKATD